MRHCVHSVLSEYNLVNVNTDFDMLMAKSPCSLFFKLFLDPMSLDFLLGFFRLLKHLCLYIGTPNTFVDTFVDHYMKLVFI